MDKVHAFISRYIHILKWIPVINVYLLAVVLSKETAAQALDYAMPLVGYFVFVPTFISLCVKTDERN